MEKSIPSLTGHQMEGELRKAVEPNLPEGKEVFSLLVDAVEDYAIFALDPQGIILTWNAGGQRLKGYRSEEVIGTNFTRFYSREDIERRHPQVELKLAAEKGKYEEEGWRVRKDGSMFWANVTITAMYLQTPGAGRILKGFAKVTRDLTARRHSEEALRGSQKKYRLLLDNITDYALILLDAQGHVTSWNTGAVKITGYTSKEILGSHFSKLYAPGDFAAKKHDHELKIAAETGRYEEESQRIRKDGSPYWASVVITCVKDELGNIRGFSKVTRDITEKKQTEERLKQSEERFRLMVEGVEDYAIFMLDPNGLVATWNRGAERNKGYAAEEIIGKYFSVFYVPEDIINGRPGQEINEAVAKGRFENEGWRVRKDGSKFWANIIITAIHDTERNLVGFSKVTRNLTERKKSEDALKASFSALETRVRLRTQELSQAKLKAENAVAARDQFFSMASHELKTPLSSLKMQTQLRKKSVLRGDFSDFKPENLLDLCEDDERQVNRLTYLVENMLDVSRLTSNTFELTYKDTNIASLIDEVLKIMAPNLQNGGNTLTVDCPKSIHGELDQTRIEQVLTNLLSNCGKYASGKPIEIKVTEQLHTISLLSGSELSIKL